jgi:YtcA family
MQNGRNKNTGSRSVAQRIVRATTPAVSLVAAVILAGCSRAPTFNILGSFFPSWILCGVIGILLAVASRLFFLHIKLEEQLKPLILVYPCLALFFTFTLWLLFFS